MTVHPSRPRPSMGCSWHLPRTANLARQSRLDRRRQSFVRVPRRREKTLRPAALTAEGLARDRRSADDRISSRRQNRQACRISSDRPRRRRDSYAVRRRRLVPSCTALPELSGGSGALTRSGHPLLGGHFLEEVRRCPTLPQGHPCSTIGAESLSFRVRNVSGRFPLAMAAETLLMCQ